MIIETSISLFVLQKELQLNSNLMRWYWGCFKIALQTLPTFTSRSNWRPGASSKNHEWQTEKGGQIHDMSKGLLRIRQEQFLTTLVDCWTTYHRDTELQRRM